jgi:ThiF family
VALAPFFDRVYGAIGGHLSVSRESLTDLLQSVVVGIRCGVDISQNDAWIAELATNLLARLYPRIAISGPDRLCSRLRNLGKEINPNIEFEEAGPTSTTICIGSAQSEGALFPSASGWVARLNHGGPEPKGPANPYASAAAASFAAAELFRRIFLRAAQDRDFSLSLLNFDSKTGAGAELPSGNLHDVLFVGVGAIGNAAIWCLARDEKRRGRLTLLDAENLELLNLQRYVLGTSTDISQPKVAIAQNELRKTHISAIPEKQTLEAFADKGIAKIPLICISVDNPRTRIAAQALLPRLIVNGWTGDAALGASWHIFSHNTACLACLYYPHGRGPSQTEQAASALGLSPDRAALLWVTRQPLSEDDIAAAARTLGASITALQPWRGKSLGELYTDVVCGAVPVNTPQTGRQEVVPLAHQSALAGTFMAAELVKRTNRALAAKSQREVLVSWDNVLQSPPTIWRKPRAREAGCICGDLDYQSTFRGMWRPKPQDRRA